MVLTANRPSMPLPIKLFSEMSVTLTFQLMTLKMSPWKCGTVTSNCFIEICPHIPEIGEKKLPKVLTWPYMVSLWPWPFDLKM